MMGGSVGKSSSDNDTQSKSKGLTTQEQQQSASGSSTSGNESQFGQNIWGTQGDALGNLYNQMSGLFGGTNQQMQGQIPGAIQQQQGIFNQANPAWQQQMGGGAFQGMDLQGNYQNALQGGGNEQFIDQSIMGGQGNNYADAMKGQLQQDSDQRLGRSLAMNDARAAGNQLSGNSRHGLTESRLHDDSNRDLARQQTGIGFNTFDKDLDRKLGIAQRADQFDMGRLQNTSQMLGQQQGAMQGGLNYGQNMQNLGMGEFAPSMAPWQAAGQYGQMMGDPTVLGSGSGSAFADAQQQAASDAQMRSQTKGMSSGDASSKGFGTGGGLFGK